MCGRFTLFLEPDEVEAVLDITLPVDARPRYNIAPTQPVAVVTSAEHRAAEWMRWGLVPGWAKDTSIASKLINARGETAAEKPAFRQAFARRRCLILADGFYEWQRIGRASQPFYFQLSRRQPFAFAGLWEEWRPADGPALRTCTIITTAANAVVAPVHERMPVILPHDSMWRWLQAGSLPELRALLAPYPAEGMMAHPVSKLVNSSGVETPDLVAPLLA